MLTIGYHQLEGKRQELKKPFAVLDRVQGGSSGGGSQASRGGEDDGGDVQYKVCVAGQADGCCQAGGVADGSSTAGCLLPLPSPPPPLTLRSLPCRWWASCGSGYCSRRGRGR